jgi:hypothetical protein
VIVHSSVVVNVIVQIDIVTVKIKGTVQPWFLRGVSALLIEKTN